MADDDKNENADAAAAAAAALAAEANGKPPTALWRESLGDPDVKGAKTLDKFKGANDRELLEQVAKGYVNLEKLPRGVTVPKDDAPQAEWDAFFEKAGRPKSVDDYGIDIKVPDGVVWNKTAERTMLEKMHRHGLSKRQAEGILTDYLNLASTALETDKTRRIADSESAYTEMKKEWGNLADRNVALVQRAVHEFGGEDFKEYLNETGLGNDPRFFKFVHAIANNLVEDGIISGDNLGMKRDDARTKLKEIMASDAWKKGGNKELTAEVEALAEIAYSE